MRNGLPITEWLLELIGRKFCAKPSKLENGEGWSLRGIEIKDILQTQVTLRHREDGRRETTFIPYEWNSRNQTKITTAVAELKRLIDDRNLTIKEAEKFRLGSSEEGSAVTVINWASIADEFIKSRSGNRLKTQQDLKTRMDRVLDIFKLKPRPINGKVFMERFAEKYFTETYTDKTRKGKLRLPAGRPREKKKLYGCFRFLQICSFKRCSSYMVASRTSQSRQQAMEKESSRNNN